MLMKIKVGKGDNPGETDGTRALAIANIMDRSYSNTKIYN